MTSIMCAESWSTFFDLDGDTDGAPTGAAAPSAKPAGQAPMSVAELLAQVKDALASALPRKVTVVGEISNFNRHGSGHLYFRLKDADATIDAVMFRSAADKLKFDPVDGLEIVATGRVDVYEVRGQLQLYVSRMTPRGTGALELAFKQLCRKLRAEGLFDAVRKPICRFPRAIGVVTSPTGAAVRDIGRTLRRRWPSAQVYLAPALVQGQEAADSIVRALSLLDDNADRYEIDTIIVSRGGGSLEDLWAFNEEPVARAIFAAKTPIISGVGHEVDITIADLVADMRAATPTAAAELAAPDAREVLRHVQAMAGRLCRSVAAGVKSARTELEGLGRSAVFRDPAGRLRTQIQRIDELYHRLGSVLRNRLGAPRRRLELAAGSLAAQHPARLADRGAADLARVANRLAWAGGGRCKRAGDVLGATETALRSVHPIHGCRLARQHVDALGRQLEALSYRSVLARGFSVTRTAAGAIIRSTSDVRAGDNITTKLIDSEIFSRVLGGNENGPEEAAPKRAARKRRSAATVTDPLLFDMDNEAPAE